MARRRYRRLAVLGLAGWMLAAAFAPTPVAGTAGYETLWTYPALDPGTSGSMATLAHPAHLAHLASRLDAGTPPVLVATQPGRAHQVAAAVKRHGGQVLQVLPDVHFVLAWVPRQALPELRQSPDVAALALDEPVMLDHREMAPPPETRTEAAPAAEDPGLSLRITRGEIGADAFSSTTGSQGQGSVIAVLDTGVDPGHPDLQQTTDGRPKIVDWQDFTGEGNVQTPVEEPAPPGVTSRSGRVHRGAFGEDQIPSGGMESDLNRDGDADDAFPVVLADTREAGRYDAAYVDTDLDGDFADETPLYPYGEQSGFATFGSGEMQPDGRAAGVNFVVTRIAADGSGLNLGYDGGEHGTHVAGIAAANGTVQGVAPGAQIMAIKVLTSGGSGAWSGILQGMHYAATHGADVINMSLGASTADNSGGDPQSRFLDALAQQHDVLFVLAAGNSGPGLNSLGVPGAAGAALTVGAYISPETFRADYGLEVPAEGLWYFSSQGPRDDGVLKPEVVAPGSARSTTPPWNGLYQLFQGTSMATPQTAGAAALLRSAAAQRNLPATAALLKEALATSARRLADYGWAEQGHGLIQLPDAWQRLGTLARSPAAAAATNLRSTGDYRRGDRTWGPRLLWLENRASQPRRLRLQYRPGAGNLQLHGPRQVWLPGEGALPVALMPLGADAPGYYDALVTATPVGSSLRTAAHLFTLIQPHRFDPLRGNRVEGITGELPAARHARHFVQVPPGTAELVVTLRVPDRQGRVRLVAYRPDGLAHGSGTGYAGAPEGPDVVELRIPHPAPGVWELNPIASHGAALYDVPVSRYELSAAARGIYALPSRLQVPVTVAGSPLYRTIMLYNLYGEVAATAEGLGFAVPERHELKVTDGETATLEFKVEPDTALLHVKLDPAPEADLAMSLYHNDSTGGWSEIRHSPEIWLPAPAAGEYALEVTGNQAPADGLTATVAVTRVRGGDGVTVVDGTVPQQTGAVQSLAVQMNPPRVTGALGAVRIRDEGGRTLQVVPIQVQ